MKCAIADALFGDPEDPEDPESNHILPTEPTKAELMESVRLHRASARYEQAPTVDETFEATARIIDVQPFTVHIPALESFFHSPHTVAWTLYDAPVAVNCDGAPVNIVPEIGDTVLLRARLKKRKDKWTVRASTLRILTTGEPFSTRGLL
jgi:hypothetical protein